MPKPLTCNYRGCTEFRAKGDTYCEAHGKLFRSYTGSMPPAPPADMDAVLLAAQVSGPGAEPPPKPCIVEGCGQPRYPRYARCWEHEKARRRDAAKPPGPDLQPAADATAGLVVDDEDGNAFLVAPTPCDLCHRTPEQAGRWAAKGVYCQTCSPWPAMAARERQFA